MKVYPLFPYDNTRRFEVFTIDLEVGCNHQSLPHNDGTEEYIVVTRGEMEVEIGDLIKLLNKKSPYSNHKEYRLTYHALF